MKSLTSDMLAYMAGDETNLQTCLLLSRTDGTVERYTEYDVDVVVTGQGIIFGLDIDGTYVSVGGYSTSEVTSTDNLSVDDIEIQAPYSAIDRDDVLAGLYDNAEFRLFAVDPDDMSLGIIKLMRGEVSQAKSAEDYAVFELRSMVNEIQQPTGKTFNTTCSADLGDSECQVNLASFTVSGTITSVTNNAVFTDSSRAEANDHFTFGLLTWTSGLNNGRSMEVKDFGSGQFELFEPMIDDVQVGDGYDVYRGCNKKFNTCRDVFDNVVNFRGFPYMPGEDVPIKSATGQYTTRTSSSAK